MDNLITLDEFNRLVPLAQGYAVYTQGAHPGSELAGMRCPYPNGSWERHHWMRGERIAILEAQDCDED